MKFLATALLSAMLIVGCASANYTTHPGSVNVFDSQTYDTLLVTHAVIESAKAEIAAGKFPPAVAADVKVAINNLVIAYNIADTAYQVYHAAAVAGTVTASQTTAVSTSLANVNTSTAALTAIQGAN